MGQQGGRDLNEINAALKRRRYESTQIADHTTAQGDQAGSPVVPLGYQEIQDRRISGHVLVTFAIIHFEDIDACGAKTLGKQITIQRVHGRVCDYADLMPAYVRGEQRGKCHRIAQEVAADVNRIGPLGEFYV